MTTSERRRRHRPEPVLPGLLRGSGREPRHDGAAAPRARRRGRRRRELNAIFRCAHSIKGGAATFGFADVAELTHQMETLLDKLRRHELPPTAAMVDVLLPPATRCARSSRATRARAARRSTRARCWRGSVRCWPAGAGAAASRPRQRRAPAAAAAAAAAAPAAAASEPRELELRSARWTTLRRPTAWSSCSPRSPDLGTIEPLDGGRASRRHAPLPASSRPARDSDLLDLFTFHVAREQVRAAAARRRATASIAGAPGAPRRGERTATIPATASSTTRRAPARADDAAPAPRPRPRADAAEAGRARRPARDKAPAAALESSTLRVSVEKVDQLINLVGELVITQAMLAQNSKRSTRRCTSSSPPAWPTWTATRATCRNR